MEMWLTKGLFGEKAEKLADGLETGAQALSALHGWKNRKDVRDAYKVERYDRFLFGEGGCSVAVDFGDYSAFVLIEGGGAKSEIAKALRP